MSHQVPASTTNTTHPSIRKKRRGEIEKKRRDKINNSLTELRRLIPIAPDKESSAKLEKAEILQMTVDYLRMLHERGLISGALNSSFAHNNTSTNSNSSSNIKPEAALLSAGASSTDSSNRPTTAVQHQQQLQQHLSQSHQAAVAQAQQNQIQQFNYAAVAHQPDLASSPILEQFYHHHQNSHHQRTTMQQLHHQSYANCYNPSY